MVAGKREGVMNIYTKIWCNNRISNNESITNYSRSNNALPLKVIVCSSAQHPHVYVDLAKKVLKCDCICCLFNSCKKEM